MIDMTVVNQVRLRIHAEGRIKDIQLDEFERLTIGHNKTCDIRLEKAQIGTAFVQFVKGKSGWTAHCKGGVIYEGHRVKTIVFAQGIILVLNETNRVALEALGDEKEQLTIDLKGVDRLLIGRRKSNDLQLANDRVSGKHATLTKTVRGWTIQDYSTNGTYVNSQIIDYCDLKDGDRIVIEDYSLTINNNILYVKGSMNCLCSALPMRAKSSEQYPFFQRSPRLLSKADSEEIVLQNAPTIQPAPETNWLSVLLPIVLMAAVYGLYAYIQQSDSMLMMLPMMAMGGIISVINLGAQKKKIKKSKKLQNEKYEQYLSETVAKINRKNEKWLEELKKSNPSPNECISIVQNRSGELWNKRPTDDDFMSLRIGCGKVKSCVRIKLQQERFEINENAYSGILKQIKEKSEVIEQAPVQCNLGANCSCGIFGARRQVITLAQNMLLELATSHGYDEVKIVVIFPSGEDEWKWARWLPHCFNASRTVRYMACTERGAGQICEELWECLKERMRSGGDSTTFQRKPLPHYAFLIADFELAQSQKLLVELQRANCYTGLSTIWIGENITQIPRTVEYLIQVDESGSGEIYPWNDVSRSQRFSIDPKPECSLESFARQMAPIRVFEVEKEEFTLPRQITFLEGYGAETAKDLGIEQRWRTAHDPGSLAVPIGVKTNGERFIFDIHEKQHGPHGLVAGMTGSGKSEMVQSWILSMAVQFSPLEVSFIIIDFKGTGLIQPFEKMPHLAGTISNLDEKIGRNLIALESDLKRRQLLFDRAGVNNIEKYLKLYQKKAVQEPISYLFVVIDEYAEFKTKYPEFTDEINMLFRTGRSLGVSVVLLTQNPAGIVSGQSVDNVRFRWCLKVANSAASKEMLGTSDAAKLLVPGRAYVKIGEDEEYELIQSFWSGAPLGARHKRECGVSPEVAVVDLQGNRRKNKRETAKKTQTEIKETEIDCVMREMSSLSRKLGNISARKVWLPRLEQEIYLEDICDFNAGGDEICPVIGIADDPYNQEHQQYRLLLSDGHHAIFGAPGTGKTVLLQTLVTSLCRSYSPEKVNVCILDFGGWNFKLFADFPHVIGYSDAGEKERQVSILKQLCNQLAQRKRDFARQGVGTICAYQQDAAGQCPYIIVVADNLSLAMQESPETEEMLLKIAREGGNYGIVLVATASSIASLGYKIRQNMNTLLALNMPEKGDYVDIVGRTDGLEPEKTRGRGLCVMNGHVLEFQTALPCRDENDMRRTEKLRELGNSLRQRYKDSHALQLKIMPKVVSERDLEGTQFGLGMAYETCLPAVALNEESHTLLISSDLEITTAGLAKRLAREAAETNGEVALFEVPMQGEAYTSLGSQQEFDSYIRSLTKRLDRWKQGQQAQTAEIYIFIGNWGKCFDNMSDDIPAQLNRIAKYAKNAGVYLVACGSRTDIIRLAGGGEAVTKTLAEGTALLIGGTLSEHLNFETDLSFKEKNTRMNDDEGWLVHKQRAEKIRLLRVEGEQ